MQATQLSVTRESKGVGWLLLAGAAAAGLLTVLARGVIDHVALYDELLHVLAARGLLETGMPLIADGVYPRGELYTRAVAWSFQQFGDTLVAARLPALAAGAALAIAICLWVGRRSGLFAGAVAALLLCVAPQTVEVAVFARFYTFHALVIGVIFVALFEAMLPGQWSPTRVALVLAAVVLVPVGWHLQETTIIAVGAGVAGVIALLILDRWTLCKSFVLRHPVLFVGALVVVATVGFVGIWYLGLWEQLGSAPLWAAGRAGRYHYYLVELGASMPLLWPLLPLAAAVALVNPTQRRLAIYCTAIVVSALVVHSVAGAKALRYVYYLVPVMCVLWALALTTLAEWAAGRPRQSTQAGDRLGPAGIVIFLAVAFVLSQEGLRTFNLLAGRLSPSVALAYGAEADWAPLVTTLKPQMRIADRLVTSNAMKALYYFGDYDFELNASIVAETETMEEFGRDTRTGRRAIGRADSVAQVLGNAGSTLVVLEEEKIGKPSGVQDEAIAVIESRCNEVSLPAKSGVRAWLCVAAP